MDKLDLTGAWWGRYVMPRGRVIAFWAAIDEDMGGFTGNTSERYPPSADGAMEGAVLRGTRAGMTVAFVKAYDGAGQFAHAVDYTGVLDPSGELLTGRWTILRASGAFEMHRSHVGDEEEIVREEEIDLTA